MDAVQFETHIGLLFYTVKRKTFFLDKYWNSYLIYKTCYSKCQHNAGMQDTYIWISAFLFSQESKFRSNLEPCVPRPDLQGAQTPMSPDRAVQPHDSLGFPIHHLHVSTVLWSLSKTEGRKNWGFGYLLSSLRRKIINAAARVNVTSFPGHALCCFSICTLMLVLHTLP